MMGDEKGGDELKPPSIDWKQRIEDKYRSIKEHAETYPYVWASYIVVYGGLFVYTTYRWRKLRKTEDRVRVLQERLRKLVESEQESSSSAKPTSSNGSGHSQK
ncbi:uncharacterized protein LOC131245120 [Magnolia sinica]|uniref:uncharacterized protein LOC131245120 n=1 Tax=Magnolia sinica TaxID=86752 RepID=UPI002657CB7E|nr:uncharacterized protein LOC131245120 [Magnolia sinica]XP_058100332.1 uncharacterized protein LOC131245120 [Magnolia sinica]